MCATFKSKIRENEQEKRKKSSMYSHYISHTNLLSSLYLNNETKRERKKEIEIKFYFVT